MTNRKAFLAAAVIAFGVMATVVAVRAQSPKQDVVLTNVSYDPTRELYSESTRPSPSTGRPRPARRSRSSIPRRLRQAGACGHRRPRGRRRDPGAGRRHRRDRRESGKHPGGLADAPAEQLGALHLDHRVPGAQGQPEGHQGLGRPRRSRASRSSRPTPRPPAARAGTTSRPGATPDSTKGDEAKAKEFVERALQERAGARLGRARLDHDLRPARHRRRADRLGERGLPHPEGVRRQTSSRSSSRRSRSWPSRRSRWSTVVDKRGTRKVAEAYLELSLHAEAQKIIAQNFYRPRNPKWPTRRHRPLPQDPAGHDRRCVRRLEQGAADHFADGGVFDQIYKPANAATR